MPQEWDISCSADQIEGTVHIWRKGSTGSEKEFQFERRGDLGSEEDH